MIARWRYPQGRLLVFTRPPHPGHVKTRLIPALGAAGAASLHARLTTRTLRLVTSCDLAPAQVWLSPTPERADHDDWPTDFPGERHRQQGDDLGQRMAHALDHALAGAAFAVLIGSDCPALDADYLDRACAALAGGSDAVLGPAEDGGYVLIGLRRQDPSLFEGIAWGGDRVYADTCARLQALGWCHQALPTLWDLDRPADLPRLAGLAPELLQGLAGPD